MEIAFTCKNHVIPPIRLVGEILESVHTFKLLGVIISLDMLWGAHTDYLHKKRSSRLHPLLLLKCADIPPTHILQIYISMLRCVLKYSCQVWHTSLTCSQSDKLEAIQRRALLIIHSDQAYTKALGLSGLSHLSDGLEELCKTIFANITDPSHRLHHLLLLTRQKNHGLCHSIVDNPV